MTDSCKNVCKCFYFVKNERQSHALCWSCKKESLALAKSKAVDLLPCYCIWLLIFYQALSYDKQNGPSMMPKGRWFFDNSATLPLTTSQKGLFKKTTSMAFSGMPGI